MSRQRQALGCLGLRRRRPDMRMQADSQWRNGMRITNIWNRIAPAILLYLGLWVFLIPQFSLAQTSAIGVGKVTKAKSRAEAEAEQQVALSPYKIIELLRQEPGLLLESKKMLVRKAYEQGRILDPEDLTDEALFQLLHEDHNICVLVTQEIVDRAYIRAKPTQEQIERERELNARYGTTAAPATPSPAPPATGSGNQEEAYWKKHDENLPPLAQPQIEPSQTVPAIPQIPRTAPTTDNPARQVEMTSLPANDETYDEMGAELAGGTQFGLNRISPEQLPALLNANSVSTRGFAVDDSA